MSNGAEPRGWKEPRRFGTAVGVSVVVLALVGFYVNVRAKDTTTTVTVSSTPETNSATVEPSTTVPTSTSSTAPPTTVAPIMDVRCEVVPAAVVTRLSAGIAPDVELVPPIYAVKSGDFQSVYFVAGRTKSGNTAVWATNNLTDGGLTLSVNSTALGISDWGDGGTTDAQLTMDRDGARIAEACAAE